MLHQSIQIPGLREIVYQPRTPIPTIIAEYLADLSTRGGSRRHRDTMRLLLTRFGERFPGPIGDLCAADARGFLLSLAAAPRTRNNWLAALRTLARFAVRRRYLPKFWDELDLVERFLVPPAPTEIYSPAEVRAILQNCSAPFLPVVLLTVFAGVRYAEGLRLSWDDVNLAEARVTRGGGQGEDAGRRVCPLAENVAAFSGGLGVCPATIRLLTASNGDTISRNKDFEQVAQVSTIPDSIYFQFPPKSA